MMGTSDPQPSLFYQIILEQFVTADHPMRKIRPLIDTDRIRQLCEPLDTDTGRPPIPPEQLFLALLGGYLLGAASERALVRELTGNLVLRWFVGWMWIRRRGTSPRSRRTASGGLPRAGCSNSCLMRPSRWPPSGSGSRRIRRSMGHCAGECVAQEFRADRGGPEAGGL